MAGPNYSRPKTLADAAEKYVYASSESTGGDDAEGDVGGVGRWWERFGDRVTSELVETALKNNNDLAAAAARVLQAEALFAEVAGGRLPQVDYDFVRSRGKTSFNFGGGRFSNISTTFSQNISVSYIVDLFGKLKRSERAAWADLLGTTAAEQALIQAVIGNVVKGRANIATIQRSLSIAKANTKNRQRVLEIIERRYERGLVGPLDVRLARENVAASKSNEIVIKLALAKAQNALDVLVGRRPGTGLPLERTLPDLPALEPIPAGVPAMLLDRRCDVRAAEFALEASCERVGVSIAALYPDLSLTGSYGRSADRFGDIFKHETEIYSAVMRLSQPIFRGGQLRAGVSGAKARYAEQASIYAKTVLTALREVEDALAAEQMHRQHLAVAEERFMEARLAQSLAEERYLQGVEPLITVLEAERKRRIAENELNGVKGQLWVGRVDLLLALGGDWEIKS